MLSHAIRLSFTTMLPTPDIGAVVLCGLALVLRRERFGHRHLEGAGHGELHAAARRPPFRRARNHRPVDHPRDQRVRDAERPRNAPRAPNLAFPTVSERSARVNVADEGARQ